MSRKKGIKGQKNVPILYDEVKERHTILLTPTVWIKLKSMAEARGISISEVIENWVRETTG
jgi:predicted DNA-binding ribbon-helix-helix protein